jgi:hypothetical protein
MGKAIRNGIAGNFDVYGIGRIANVVVDVVTGMPADGKRLSETARSLLVRLAQRVGAGHVATARCCLRPVHAGATWTPEPASSGAWASRLHERLGRPRSVIRSGRV